MNKFFLILLFFINNAFAATDLEKVQFIFLSATEAQSFLSKEDDYTKKLSPLDLSLYHSTPKTISNEEHLEFLKTTTQDWTDLSKASLNEKIETFKSVISKLNLKLNLPEKILLIKTNGEDAFHAHYTRGNAIIFPASLNGEIETDLGTFYHEMFHIFSRHNPDLSDDLYSLCGFYPIQRLKLPAELEKIRTTNPDAFNFDHALKVSVNGSEHFVVPFMYSAIKQEDINGPVNEALVYKLGLLDLDTLSNSAPVMYKTAETNYKDAVRANSHYYIHPEEIMAEDFRLLMLQNTEGVPSPVVKFQAVLDQLKAKL